MANYTKWIVCLCILLQIVVVPMVQGHCACIEIKGQSGPTIPGLGVVRSYLHLMLRPVSSKWLIHPPGPSCRILKLFGREKMRFPKPTRLRSMTKRSKQEEVLVGTPKSAVKLISKRVFNRLRISTADSL
jgi:hypothetical protein